MIHISVRSKYRNDTEKLLNELVNRVLAIEARLAETQARGDEGRGLYP